MADIHSQIHSGPDSATLPDLALRQQGSGYARPVGVTSPAPCCSVELAVSPPPRILRLPEVIARVGLKRASIYLHMAAGSFPKSISLGPRAVGWLEREIDAWIIARVQIRRNR